jgi:hypothetical protein
MSVVSALRSLSAVPLMAAVCLLAGGCSITRKSASIDSISRTPFFGLELAPKRNTPAPETHRIRQEASVPVDVKPAKLMANGIPKEASWWQRLTGVEMRSSIALPRTDLAGTPAVPPPPAPAPAEDKPEFW